MVNFSINQKYWQRESPLNQYVYESGELQGWISSGFKLDQLLFQLLEVVFSICFFLPLLFNYLFRSIVDKTSVGEFFLNAFRNPSSRSISFWILSRSLERSISPSRGT
jgi:hypothetical protein